MAAAQAISNIADSTIASNKLNLTLLSIFFSFGPAAVQLCAAGFGFILIP